MNSRMARQSNWQPLLKLIKRRYGLRLPVNSVSHLRMVGEHYSDKRRLLLWEHGEAGAMVQPDYAKAVLISEVVRSLLREIDPWPRRKQNKRNKQSYG